MPVKVPHLQRFLCFDFLLLGPCAPKKQSIFVRLLLFSRLGFAFTSRSQIDDLGHNAC